jgi:hypothetical protein
MGIKCYRSILSAQKQISEVINLAHMCKNWQAITRKTHRLVLIVNCSYSMNTQNVVYKQSTYLRTLKDWEV